MTGPVAALAGRVLDRPTADQLVAARAVLVVLTAAALVCGVLTVETTYDEAESVRDRTSQALLEIASARAGLIDAHAAVVRSFGSGEVELSGPGGEYLGRLGSASQSLARVAELNTAGEQASQILEVTSTLLSSFSGAVGQADANNRSGDRALALADLSYASRTLHQNDGLLAQLDRLAVLQRAVLQDEVDGGAARSVPLVLWCVLSALLLVALVVVQVEMRRRFRRTLNPPLLVATLAVVACCVGIVLTLVSVSGLHRTAEAVDVHRATATANSDATDLVGRRQLTALIRQQCGRQCGETVEESELVDAVVVVPATTVQDVTTLARSVNTLSSDAADSVGMRAWVPTLLVVTGMMAAAALYRRIDEYRSRTS